MEIKSQDIQNNINIFSFYDLFNKTIENKTILIFEPNKYHHECTPGYSKYFVDLDYNVDVLTHISGIDSFSLFGQYKKIRLILFNHLDEIKRNSKKLSFIIKKYNYVLIQTTNHHKKELYKKLGFFNINTSIFVFHDINKIDKYYSNYLKLNRIWTIGNFSKGLQVNPHYFGNIQIKEKTDKTRFFLTSTFNRNYTFLIEASRRLKQENFNFELVVTGRSKSFNSNQIPKYLNNTFIFKHKVSYNELYKSVESSDYIIIPINNDNKINLQYKKNLATGSIQLVYGFLKPALINKEFASFYNLNGENSLIYNNIFDFYYTMKKAILLKNNDYKQIQGNLKNAEKDIYRTSINNLKKVINEF